RAGAGIRCFHVTGVQTCARPIFTDVSILAAFIAGVFSISSPCVLPLIPIYLTHIAGVSVGERESAQRSIVLRNAGAYVAGFSIVFILLGVATGAVRTSATSRDFCAQSKS